MNVKLIDVSRIDPAPYNPRVELLPGDEEYQQIEASLDEFGLVEPLVWNEHNGRLVGGHQRFNILKAKGRKKVHVSVVTIDDEAREKALNVALNQGGRWDIDKLGALMGDLDTEPLRRASGMSSESLDKLRATFERGQTIDALRNALGDSDSAPAPAISGLQPSVDGRREVCYSFDGAQYRTVMDAINTAKEKWGSLTAMDAVVEICRYFTEQATEGAK